jgi:hypothetical protein
LAQKTGVLAEFGNFHWVLWNFGVFRVVSDLFVNIFWKPRAVLEFLQTSEDYGEIFNKYRGFGANL